MANDTGRTEERLIDGYWGISELLDQVEAEVRKVLDGGRTAIVRWSVEGRKT